MPAEEIEVKIRPDGRVEILVKGATGKRCVDLTQPLESALGGVVAERKYTSEYYAPEGCARQSEPPMQHQEGERGK